MAEKKIKKKILIVSTDAAFVSQIDNNLCLRGYDTVVIASHSKAIAFLEKSVTSILFLDIENIPSQEMNLVNYIKTRYPHIEIVILATIKELDDATYAMRNGASFYLMKPLSCSDMKTVIDRLAVKADNNREHLELEQQLLTDLMGENQTMQKMLRLAMKIAPTTSTVCIGGESGTGKEFFAKIIHRMSRRIDGQFVAVNCGAIPDTLFESELFGHKKGSFTGADRDKPGLVEEAHLGTLFLDEVGELTQLSQVKLLRFLQERSFRRIGENVHRTVNVRIIAASNKHLPTLVKEGKFREDLFYRLNVFYLHLPPLRERRDTIPNLIRLFLHRFNTITGKKVNRISKAAEIILANYEYPGNVRELENIIEHAVVLAEGNELTEKELPELVFRNRLLLTAPECPCAGVGYEAGIITLDELEKNYITQALGMFDNNFSETADRLGISRTTLWRKIREYGIKTKNRGKSKG